MSIKTVGDDGEVREFSTGATRGTKEGKLCYSGFFSPLVLKRVAEYMHKHRHLENGGLRAPDNWQRGMPVEEYMDSMWRHFFDVWANQRGFGGLAESDDLVEALCALFFNVQGMMHEELRREFLYGAGQEELESDAPERDPYKNPGIFGGVDVSEFPGWDRFLEYFSQQRPAAKPRGTL